MTYIIAGLGNPGEEYENTRHNVGRMVLEDFRIEHGFPEWAPSKKLHALLSESVVEKEKVTLIEPDNFMNRSGGSLKPLITSVKKADHLVVVYDDLDLPLGLIRVAHDRGTGGHNGLESVVKSIGTKKFIRVRVGIAPVTPTGKIKKPKGEQGVLDFLLGEFKKKEKEALEEIVPRATQALVAIMKQGKEKAMLDFNSSVKR